MDERVAAIFWLTSPDFPMPVTTTLPLERRISFTAASKDFPVLRESRNNPSASIFKTRLAVEILIEITFAGRKAHL